MVDYSKICPGDPHTCRCSICKQRGGKLKIRTYVLLAVLALVAIVALSANHEEPGMTAEQVALEELYQLTPDEWNEQSYEVTVQPEEAQVCDSFVEHSVCTIRI